ncbi:hypothetical protein ACFZA2_10400 [Microbacterium sp. NPDC007973]|uniref:hypothetical protein n=1 Tax=Microbacterium sp. NPDC007973 TaxID=3364182 RepID=UPI0036E1065D
MAARATTTTKPAPAQVEEYDFDSWTEDDETKALVALAPDIKHIIVERSFVGRFRDGTIIKLPLDISLDDIDVLTEKYDNPVDQIKALLTQIGGEDAAKEFTRQNMADAIALAQKFFAIFARIAGATVPES